MVTTPYKESTKVLKISSHPLTTSFVTRDCRLRLFAHMHGQGVGNLTVFARDADGSLQQLHQEHGAQPDMDINAWRRLKVCQEKIIQNFMELKHRLSWKA